MRTCVYSLLKSRWRLIFLPCILQSTTDQTGGQSTCLSVYLIKELINKRLVGMLDFIKLYINIIYIIIMWPSTGKPGTTRLPSKKFFLHLRSCRRPDIELSKFYCRSLSRSHYNRPNCSLLSAWNNTFLRNWSIFSRYLRTPRCARFSCRRSHMYGSYCGSYNLIFKHLINH